MGKRVVRKIITAKELCTGGNVLALGENRHDDEMMSQEEGETVSCASGTGPGARREFVRIR